MHVLKSYGQIKQFHLLLNNTEQDVIARIYLIRRYRLNTGGMILFLTMAINLKAQNLL